MRIRSFGKLSDGKAAGLYILSNRNGMEAHLTEYGASIVRLIVPDRQGSFRDVVLGYDDVSGYEKGASSFGGIVGRYANRISNASFDMNGRHYILTANDGPNTLHGGRDFYNQRMWSPVISFGTVSTSDIAAAYAVESMNDWSREPRGRERVRSNDLSEQAAGELAQGAGDIADRITFRLISPDGDQGFPGEICIEVTYTLTEANELHIDYHAFFSSAEEGPAIRPSSRKGNSVSGDNRSSEIHIPPTEDSAVKTDQGRERIVSTPLNLTNHSYFNLNGHDSGTVLMQKVRIDADKFTETDSRSIPTGTLLDVKWTPMDFRKPKTLTQDINNDYEPLRFGRGYDHNYVLRGADGSYDYLQEQEPGSSFIAGQCELREVAHMVSDDSGICMTILTDLPGMQLYTANYLTEEPGKDGAFYDKRSAVCFETQFWPDTVNKDGFPGGVLSEGEEFTSRTTYQFSVVKE